RIPLVHVKLLEFEGQDAHVFRVLRVQPAGKKTAHEFHVLPNVERSAPELLAFEGSDEGIDQGGPPVTIHGSGADVDLGVLYDALSWLIGTAAAMVIAMDVQYEHAVPPFDELIQQTGDFSIKPVVLCQ